MQVLRNAAFLVASVLTAHAQFAKPRAQNQAHFGPVQRETADALGLPLPESTIVSVPVRYRGMNVGLLYNILQGGLGQVHQSEFATKAQYEAKLESIKTLPLLESRKIGDQYTFVLGGGWDGQGSVPQDGGDALSYMRGAIQASYDAELQLMTVTIPAVLGLEYGSENVSLGWNYAGRSTGHHVGQNAFGVKRTITDGVSLQYSLEASVTDLAWLSRYCSQELGRDVQCRFPLSVNEARAANHTLRVAMGATLKAPFTQEQKGKSTAPIDHPYENIEVKRGVYVVPNQIVIFNGATGTILAQYSRSAFQNDYALRVVIAENKAPNWSNPLCYGALVRDSSISFSYQIDDEKEVHIFRPDKPLDVRAKTSVRISAPFCVIPRLSVLRDGVPYSLSCENQTHFAMDTSKCEVITKP